MQVRSCICVCECPMGRMASAFFCDSALQSQGGSRIHTTIATLPNAAGRCMRHDYQVMKAMQIVNYYSEAHSVTTYLYETKERSDTEIVEGVKHRGSCSSAILEVSV